MTEPVSEDSGPAERPEADPRVLAQLSDAFDSVEVALLGSPVTLTRIEVAERAGVPLELAAELWHLLGFAHLPDDQVAFTEADVEAARMAWELLRAGIIDADSQAALVRTWGRSFARLAEWQTNLLAGIAATSEDPTAELETLVNEVVPQMERLQSYIWRRHVMSAASRLVAVGSPGAPAVTKAVGFVDIVGYTTRSKNLTETELVDWIEHFEQEATGVVVDHGGIVIKMIGDEILFVTDDVRAAVEIALVLTARGQDEDDPFPAVRAGIAYGEVVNRLGDVFGPTVNIAARLTAAARPGTVVVDAAAHEELRPADSGGLPLGPDQIASNVVRAIGAITPRRGEEEAAPGGEVPPDAPTVPMDVVRVDAGEESPYQSRRLRRLSVKGYSRLEAWVVRRPRDWAPPELRED